MKICRILLFIGGRCVIACSYQNLAMRSLPTSLIFLKCERSLLLSSSSSRWGYLLQVHEACMLLCSVLVDGIKAQELEFDVLNFVQQVVLPDIRANGKVLWPKSALHSLKSHITVLVHMMSRIIASPLLTGRCLWLAGKMSSLLPSSVLLKYAVW